MTNGIFSVPFSHKSYFFFVEASCARIFIRLVCCDIFLCRPSLPNQVLKFLPEEMQRCWPSDASRSSPKQKHPRREAASSFTLPLHRSVLHPVCLQAAVSYNNQAFASVSVQVNVKLNPKKCAFINLSVASHRKPLNHRAAVNSHLSDMAIRLLNTGHF